jgi:hypothetical protein
MTIIGELGTTLAVTFIRYILILFLRSVLLFVVTANVFLTSPILVTLLMEAMRSSETSVLTRATRRNVPKDCILDGQSVRIQWFWVLCVSVRNLQVLETHVLRFCCWFYQAHFSARRFVAYLNGAECNILSGAFQCKEVRHLP